MTHECYYRGCHEVVGTDRRYCDRHEAIDEKRKAVIADRARMRAAEKRTQGRLGH